MNKVCQRCGHEDRYKSGRCRPCTRASVARYVAAHPERRSASQAAYGSTHRAERAVYLRRKCTDPGFRICKNLRSRVGDAIRNGQKAGSAVRDLGCTVEELKKHLESRFRPGMTWENWSPTGWHIDHIKPLASFDLTDRAQFLQACCYTNLQPLWAEDNLKKGASVGP